MGGDVLYHLPGLAGPVAVLAAAPRADAVQYFMPVLGCAVHVAGVARVKDVALDGIPRVIAEKSNAVAQHVQGALVRRAGVGVNGIGGAAVVELQMVKVVGVFPVAGKRQAPHAVPLPLQMMCAQVVGVWLSVGTGGKQLHRDGRRRGGPQLKGGSRRRVVGTQVGAVIVRQFTGLLPIHVHSLLK